MHHRATTQAVAFLESWLDYRSRHADIPGFSVAVWVNDSVVFSRAYGDADAERHKPLTTDHLFQMASQTKMLTAVAIMQLIEAGRLKLTDRAYTYLPWLAKHLDKGMRTVTIKQLLCHQSGLLRDGDQADHWLFTEPSPRRADFEKLILQTPLTFAPGTRIKYSNLGYGLLGQIIEAVSGQSYRRYVTEAIIRKVALRPVYVDFNQKFAESVPVGYGVPLYHHRPPIIPRQAAQSLAAATGLHATPAGMVTLAAGLFFGDNRLLNDRSKKRMQTSYSIGTGYDQGVEFGLGHEIQQVGQWRVVGHSGHVGGHVSATYFDSARKVAVAVAANAKDAPSAAIAQGIIGVLDFFDRSTPLKVPAQARFAARLYNEMSTVQIVHIDNIIVVIDPDDWQPFSWYETAKILDDSTLQVTTKGSIYNEDELIRYTFDGEKVKKVVFAGFTMYPDKDWYK